MIYAAIDFISMNLEYQKRIQNVLSCYKKNLIPESFHFIESLMAKCSDESVIIISNKIKRYLVTTR